MGEIKLLSVFVENKIGTFSKVTEVLAERQINIRWFKFVNGSDAQFGTVRFLVDEPEDAIEAFKQKNMIATSVKAIAVQIDDKPGVLAHVASTLNSNGISIRNGSSFVKDGETYLLLELEEPEKALCTLKGNGYRI